jgi:hypothetical protein
MNSEANMIDVPASNNPVWKELISGQKNVTFTFLATKLLLFRLQMETRKNPGIMDKSITELRDLFQKHVNLESVQRDLASITQE